MFLDELVALPDCVLPQVFFTAALELDLIF